jgi:hypothetical protein
MREIKFRAWDSDYDKMRYVEEFTIRYEKDNGFHSGGYADNGDYGDYILMQYTGLKDKNGKEVYEGDVVTCASLVANCLHEIVLQEEIGGLIVGGMPGYALKGCKGYAWTSEEEIVGNKFENPELINEKTN